MKEMEKQTTQEYEKAITYIIDRIKEGSLQLGSKLPPERKIAEELGIGRNSIREAISILHGMGLIDRVQGSGNYVSKHVGESIRQSLTVMLALGTITKEEIFEFRRVMEKAVCTNLIVKGLSYEYESILETKLDEMKLLEGKDLTDVDKEFHDTLIHATGNHLWAVLMEAVTEAYRDRHQSQRRYGQGAFRPWGQGKGIRVQRGGLRRHSGYSGENPRGFRPHRHPCQQRRHHP